MPRPPYASIATATRTVARRGIRIAQTCYHCDDGVKNGDETDVDCGGRHCTTKCAQGKTCAAAADCATSFCEDGVCCEIACTDACYTCNLMGSVGTCDLVPNYGDDTNYGMNESCLATNGVTCNGAGLCKKALNVECATSIECASNKCGDPDMDGKKTCVKAIGDSCSNNAECYSNICSNGTCM